MGDSQKFCFDQRVVQAIGKSPIRFKAIYDAAHKSQSVWRRATGQTKVNGKSVGVVLATFLQFCDAINEAMGWSKSPVELCRPDDRTQLSRALRQLAGELDAGDSTEIEDDLAANIHVNANRLSLDVTSRRHIPRAYNTFALSFLVALGLLGGLWFSFRPTPGDASHHSSDGQLAEPSMPQVVSAPRRPVDESMQLIAPATTTSVEAIQPAYRDWLRSTSEVITHQFSDAPLKQAEYRVTLGTALYSNLAISASVSEFEGALATYKRCLDNSDPRIVQTQHWLARTYAATGRLTQAETLAAELLVRRHHLLGESHRDTIETYRLLGDIAFASRNLDKASAMYSYVAKLAKERGFWEDFEYIWRNLAQVEAEKRDFQAARSILHEHWSVCNKMLGSNDARSLEVLRHLGEQYIAGQPDVAEQILTNAYQQTVAACGPGHMSTMLATRSLAAAKSKRGMNQEAERLYLKALAIEQQLYESCDDREMMSLCFYARLLRDTNRLQKARAVMRYVVRQNSRRLGDGHLQSAACLRTMASIQRESGRFESELFCQLRTLFSRIRVHGLLDYSTWKASQELVTCTNHCVARALCRTTIDYALLLLDEIRVWRRLPTGVPYVTTDSVTGTRGIEFRETAGMNRAG